MDFIENIRVSKERAEAGFGAEQDRPATIFGVWKICRIRITEDTSAEGDEFFRTGVFFVKHQFGNISHKDMVNVASWR